MISLSVSKHGKDLHDIKINSFNGIFSTSLHPAAIHLQQCQHDIQSINIFKNWHKFQLLSPGSDTLEACCQEDV